MAGQLPPEMIAQLQDRRHLPKDVRLALDQRQEDHDRETEGDKADPQPLILP